MPFPQSEECRVGKPCTRSMWCDLPAKQVSFLFFFFSSRRRHTRLQGDWSSDVCSSDLSHDCLVVVITVFAALGVIMLMTPSGRDILVVGGFGLSAKLKRKS